VFNLRQLSQWLVVAFIFLAVAEPAVGRDYPDRPVRIVVGFAAGGAFDTTARLIGQWLSRRLGQPFIIENRPGAGGTLAAEAVVRAEGDGHTLLLLGDPDAINAALNPKIGFNLVRDIAPVAAIMRMPYIMVAPPSFPARAVPEFIAYAKAHPRGINMASVGIGSGPHAVGELFKQMAGVELTHVPYRGSAPALADLLGGQVQVMFVSVSSAIEYVKSGRLRALAVTASGRLETLPDVPAVAEFVPGYEASTWQGIGAPRNTSVDIVGKLNKEINAGLADPEVKARLVVPGSAILPGLPADFGGLIQAETLKWAHVVTLAGMKPE
jgi:tripartite-type tricarboxylate transporter receptor subunit TctC